MKIAPPETPALLDEILAFIIVALCPSTNREPPELGTYALIDVTLLIVTLCPSINTSPPNLALEVSKVQFKIWEL